MKIIDKNVDFYDYWQDIYRDTSLIFDRRNSFVLTKEMICKSLHLFDSEEQGFMLLQICNSFFLFYIQITEWSNTYWNKAPINYDISLVSYWKNYSKPRCLIKLWLIDFYYRTTRMLFNNKKILHDKDDIYDFDLVVKKAEILRQAIDSNDYEELVDLSTRRVEVAGNAWENKHIPILKASGISKALSNLELDVYLSFEEFFSSEKTSSERTESVGITDIEKIENHGFDTKISFRGV